MALRTTDSDEDVAAHRQLFQNGFFVGSIDSVAWAAPLTECHYGPAQGDVLAHKRVENYFSSVIFNQAFPIRLANRCSRARLGSTRYVQPKRPQGPPHLARDLQPVQTDVVI
jgi:hypothetical protein